jgi:hypothetical protein
MGVGGAHAAQLQLTFSASDSQQAIKVVSRLSLFGTLCAAPPPPAATHVKYLEYNIAFPRGRNAPFCAWPASLMPWFLYATTKGERSGAAESRWWRSVPGEVGGNCGWGAWNGRISGDLRNLRLGIPETSFFKTPTEFS